VLVHLLPLGRGRYEVYAEPPETDHLPLDPDAGRIRRWVHTAGARWRGLVDAARLDDATGRFARWRDSIICGLAESIDEQRALWSLRSAAAATARFPSGLESTVARATLIRILAGSLAHHRQWFVIDLALFIVSGIVAFLPGPNVLAYYLGFRAFGHLQSWRGARQATTGVQWTLEQSEELAELAVLAEQSHASRAARVEAIATRLGLPRLAAFFERAAT
jgi:Mitochondrial K+-H+ exchange-related